MKKYSLAFYVDIIFAFIISFILSTVLVSYFLPFPYSVIVSFCLAVIFSVFTVKLLKKRRENRLEAEREKENLSAVTDFLNSSAAKSNCELFFNAYKNLNKFPQKTEGGICLACDNTSVFLRFSFDPVKKSDIFKIANKLRAERKAVIFSETFSDEVVLFAARFNGKIILKDGKDAYELLKSANSLPKVTTAAIKEKKPSADFSRLLDKKRAKNYLIYGVFFTVLSYFAPIKLYYLIFGAVFLLFSLIIRLFGKEKVS